MTFNKNSEIIIFFQLGKTKVISPFTFILLKASIFFSRFIGQSFEKIGSTLVINVSKSKTFKCITHIFQNCTQ